MLPEILFRRDLSDPDVEAEWQAVNNYFPEVVERRRQLRGAKNLATGIYIPRMVIGRYSVLPYYRELEQDCAVSGHSLINTYEQHQWIADFKYYKSMRDVTPETCKADNFHRWDYEGPFVVKGATNSRKQRWDKEMYAPTRQDAARIASYLSTLPYIGEQKIIIRKYIPLVTYETGLHGLPFTNEWRFFFCGTKEIAHGYYWSQAEYPEKATLTEEAVGFANKVAKRVARVVNFFVLDIAQTEEGNWILIEINDGQMSGLSLIDPDEFYRSLSYELKASARMERGF